MERKVEAGSVLRERPVSIDLRPVSLTERRPVSTERRPDAGGYFRAVDTAGEACAPPMVGETFAHKVAWGCAELAAATGEAAPRALSEAIVRKKDYLHEVYKKTLNPVANRMMSFLGG